MVPSLKFQLATVYAAAIPVNAAHPEAARRLIDVLTSSEIENQRRAGGFEPIAAV